MKRVLVIGATGTIGRLVVSQLQAAGAPVRALARRPDIARLPSQVEAVRGDLAVPESLDRCLENVDAIFLVWTAPPLTVAPVVERIAKHARRIVFLSSPYKTAHPMFQRPQPNPVSALHSDIEQSIGNSGLEWTFLRPGMIASNALAWWAPQIRAGNLVRWPYLAAPTAPIDERDIAAVAVRALREEKHAGTEYVLTGPESLTQLEQITAISRAIGRPLRIEEVSPEQARNEFFAQGPAFIANMLFAAWQGAIGQPALITSAVTDITGKPARTFFEWAVDHAKQFEAQLTAS